MFLEVICNLWANYYKCYFLGCMHHVGSGLITQKLVILQRASTQTYITSVNKRFMIQNLFEQVRPIITLRENI